MNLFLADFSQLKSLGPTNKVKLTYTDCVPHFSGPDTQSSHQFFMPMSGRTARFIWPELQSQYIEYTGKKYRPNMFKQRERCILLQQQPAQTEIMSLKSRLRDEMCLSERTDPTVRVRSSNLQFDSF